jgi:hypothetical protein
VDLEYDTIDRWPISTELTQDLLPKGFVLSKLKEHGSMGVKMRHWGESIL